MMDRNQAIEALQQLDDESLFSLLAMAGLDVGEDPNEALIEDMAVSEPEPQGETWNERDVSVPAEKRAPIVNRGQVEREADDAQRMKRIRQPQMLPTGAPIQGGDQSGSGIF